MMNNFGDLSYLLLQPKSIQMTPLKRLSLQGVLIFNVLEIRFGLDKAHPISDRIAPIDDLQRLKQLLRAAIQATSLEAFERMLNDV